MFPRSREAAGWRSRGRGGRRGGVPAERGRGRGGVPAGRGSWRGGEFESGSIPATGLIQGSKPQLFLHVDVLLTQSLAGFPWSPRDLST